MRVFLLVAAMVLWVAGIGLGAGEKEQLQDAEIQAILDDIHGQPRMWNVSPGDGNFLHDFIVDRGYQRGLEIGTSNGYSAIWMAMALRKTGGGLITLEIDEERAARARKNFSQVRLDDVIELREGDALKIIPELEGPFDFVFIDAWKEDYIRYLRLVYPKVRVGGAILAHNVISHQSDMREFLEAIENHPGLDTWIDRRSSAGISVSVKRTQTDER